MIHLMQRIQLILGYFIVCHFIILISRRENGPKAAFKATTRAATAEAGRSVRSRLTSQCTGPELALLAPARDRGR